MRACACACALAAACRSSKNSPRPGSEGHLTFCVLLLAPTPYTYHANRPLHGRTQSQSSSTAGRTLAIMAHPPGGRRDLARLLWRRGDDDDDDANTPRGPGLGQKVS